MKILLIGDASNYHHTLSVGLARLGHQVTVASHGSYWMDTRRHIDLSRRRDRMGGLLLWLRLKTLLAHRLRGYDVVQVHNPVFVDLRPQRVGAIFRSLRRHNGAVFLTALGTDTPYVDLCLAPDSPLRYSEFAAYGEPTGYVRQHPEIVTQWHSPSLAEHTRYVYDHIDGAVTALYEYHLSCLRRLPPDMVAYGGIPVDTASITCSRLPSDIDTVRVAVACHKGREAEKGIDVLMPLVGALRDRNPGRVEVDLIQNVPFAQFQERMRRAHVVVDQLYSYTPATSALMAMAAGKVVVSGAESEYYDFIGEDTLRPIVNADIRDLPALDARLQALVDRPALLAALSEQSRRFVEIHNDAEVVARRFVDFWERRMR